MRDNQNAKYKDKIKKLLALSNSDNENEAATALRQAMSLMRQHNITREDIDQQEMKAVRIQLKYRRIPLWYLYMHNKACELNGCISTYKNSGNGTPARITIIGREKDIENAEFLIDFFEKNCEQNIKLYKNKWMLQGVKLSKRDSQSFKRAFIETLADRVEKAQKVESHNRSSTGLICIDNEIRKQEAHEWATKKFKLQERNTRVQKCNAEAFFAGIMAAQQVLISNQLKDERE